MMVSDFFGILESHCLEHIKTPLFPEFSTFWKTTCLFYWFGRKHTECAFKKKVKILNFHEICGPILEILEISNLLLSRPFFATPAKFFPHEEVSDPTRGHPGRVFFFEVRTYGIIFFRRLGSAGKFSQPPEKFLNLRKISPTSGFFSASGIFLSTSNFFRRATGFFRLPV
jgi:hypothetical protein